MFPTSLILTEEEQTAIIKWFRNLKDKDRLFELALEEQCVIGSPFHFKIEGSGLGDIKQVCAGKHSANFGYDDDGEFYFIEKGDL